MYDQVQKMGLKLMEELTAILKGVLPMKIKADNPMPAVALMEILELKAVAPKHKWGCSCIRSCQ